jgi:hypothetical protein
MLPVVGAATYLVCRSRTYGVLLGPFISYNSGDNSKVGVPVWRFWGAIQIEIFSLHILKSASTNSSCCNWLMSYRLGRLKPMVWRSVQVYGQSAQLAPSCDQQRVSQNSSNASKIVLDANKIGLDRLTKVYKFLLIFLSVFLKHLDIKLQGFEVKHTRIVRRSFLCHVGSVGFYQLVGY